MAEASRPKTKNVRVKLPSMKAIASLIVVGLSVLLFVGYGLEDWDVRTIYNLLIEKAPRRSRNMSFAIQKAPTPFWARFWEKKGVTIYDIDLDEFAKQLEREYARRSKPRRSTVGG